MRVHTKAITASRSFLALAMTAVLLPLNTGAVLRASDVAETAADNVERLHESARVLNDIMATPDKGIPDDLLDRAHCVVIVPSLKKGAFIVGAKYGKGFISCRKAGNKGWSAPGAVKIEGGSVGFQIGGSESEVVLLVMNARGADRLLSSKFTIGGEGSVAAGPVGRTAKAETDAKMTAEMLSWSRARGVFAGISLEGATLREDRGDNAAMYGARLSNREIVTKWKPAPKGAEPLLQALNKYSPHELK